MGVLRLLAHDALVDEADGQAAVAHKVVFVRGEVLPLVGLRPQPAPPG